MALPYSKILIHQPSIGQTGGQATDIEITARELLATRRIIAEIYERTTHEPAEANEAQAYGLIDRVLDGSTRTGTAA